MITLEQAITIATQAHKDQWRKPEPLDHSVYFYKLKDYPEYAKQAFFINEEGFKISIDDTGWIMQKPYITHPLAVMSMMDTEEEKIIAVLHDIFEDSTAQLGNRAKEYNFNERECSIKFADITYSITSNLWASLYALTKPNSDWDKFKEKGHYQSYQGYIKDITLNKTATKVKIADIVHNLSCSPSDHAKEKYLKAMSVLLKSL